MARHGQPYTAGRWVVKEGSEDEFIARWTAFTEWALANAPGAEGFVLIREVSDPKRFISFGAWDDMEHVRGWKATPEFAQRLAACRELCDEFMGLDYEAASVVGALTV